MIELDGKAVGEMNFFLDRRPIITPKANTAWAGIVIGVFEFNEVALSFYKKMGYQEIARLSDYTFSKGRIWADIRMLKEF